MHDPISTHQAERAGAKDLLRFLTCGSVDDGKSTLIGRLLHDTKSIFDDELAMLAKDSVRHGTTGSEIDFALLVDGLETEREQGIISTLLIATLIHPDAHSSLPTRRGTNSTRAIWRPEHRTQI